MVCSIYARVIIVQVELQGTWFFEVTQYQLVLPWNSRHYHQRNNIVSVTSLLLQNTLFFLKFVEIHWLHAGSFWRHIWACLCWPILSSGREWFLKMILGWFLCGPRLPSTYYTVLLYWMIHIHLTIDQTHAHKFLMQQKLLIKLNTLIPSIRHINGTAKSHCN